MVNKKQELIEAIDKLQESQVVKTPAISYDTEIKNTAYKMAKDLVK